MIAIALLVAAVPIAAEGPQVFRPYPTNGPEHGSITLTRILGDVGPLPINPPRSRVEGAIVRIQQVVLNEGALPSLENLSDPEWVLDNTTPVEGALPQVGITGPNGEVTFNTLPLGIWLVEELATHLTNTNPIAPERFFNPFLVGVPSWIPEIEDGVEVGGLWLYDVRVYPKSQIPRPEGSYKDEVEIAGNIITWEIGTRIPAAVGSLAHFSAVDMLSEGLSFVDGSVVGRFTMPGDVDGTWEEATGSFVEGDFTVTRTGQRIDIYITEAGRDRLAEYGLLSTGNVMFRLSTIMETEGTHENNANWFTRAPEPPLDCIPGEDDDCPWPTSPPPCDPEVEECDPDEIYDFCFLFPNHPDCIDREIDFCDRFPELCATSRPGLSLEVLKKAIDLPLPGAQFRVYRELAEGEEAPEGVTVQITTTGARVIPLSNAAGVLEGTTNADGILNFNRAPMTSVDHNIWLRETLAPAGFRYIDPWMVVQVTPAYARPETYIVDVIVYNEPIDGWRLPDTGGVGTLVLTTVGLALVGGALLLFISGKKDEEVA